MVRWQMLVAVMVRRMLTQCMMRQVAVVQIVQLRGSHGLLVQVRCTLAEQGVGRGWARPFGGKQRRQVGTLTLMHCRRTPRLAFVTVGRQLRWRNYRHTHKRGRYEIIKKNRRRKKRKNAKNNLIKNKLIRKINKI